MTNDNFDAWFNEQEGYGSRAERFYEDIQNPVLVKDWLLAAYNQGVRDANKSTIFDKLFPNPTYVTSPRTCSRCRISLEGVMGCVCTDQHCPTFMKTTC